MTPMVMLFFSSALVACMVTMFMRAGVRLCGLVVAVGGAVAVSSLVLPEAYRAIAATPYEPIAFMLCATGLAIMTGVGLADVIYDWATREMK